MQPGRELKLLPVLTAEVPLPRSKYDLDVTNLNKIVSFFNDKAATRRAPYYFYINPDLKWFSQELGIRPETALKALSFLSSRYPDILAMKAILKVPDDNLFYILQEEDIEELQRENIVRNPQNPDIVYHEANKKIRHAFVMGLPGAEYGFV